MWGLFHTNPKRDLSTDKEQRILVNLIYYAVTKSTKHH